MTTSRWLPKLLSKSTLERTALQAMNHARDRIASEDFPKEHNDF